MKSSTRIGLEKAGVLTGVASLILVVLSPTPARAEGDAARLCAKDDGTRVTVRLADQVVVRYRYGGKLFKPYVDELRLPDGRNLLRDAPPDHLHHHGLMFAWNVDKVEFWGEAGAVGRQLHEGFAKPVTDARDGSLTLSERLRWVAPDGKTPLLFERRTVRAHRDSGPADRLVTWVSEFAGPDPKRDVTITGRNYLGLGLRFPVPMDRGSSFMTADGKTEVARVNGSQSRWCAITGNVAPNRPITLAVLDDPRNPRAPAKWFAMDRAFAYISATIGLADNPFVLKAGQRVVLRYGVAAWSKPVEAAQVEQTYQAWQKLVGARR